MTNNDVTILNTALSLEQEGIAPTKSEPNRVSCKNRCLHWPYNSKASINNMPIRSRKQ